MDNPVDPVAFEPPTREVWDGPPPPYPPGGDPSVLPPQPPVEREVPDAPAPPDNSDGTLGSAAERLETLIATGVSSILGEFRDKLALDRFKEDQITRLHEEVQAFRNDLVLRTVRQVLQGLIRLHDDMGKVAASLRERPAEELTPERVFQQIEGFRDDVELLLGQHGVERFEAAVEEFDPRRQTALRTVPAGDPAQVGRIAERLRPGFEQGETLLQKERVAVFAATSGTNEKAKEEIGS
jgi:molecular chaperone GrpE (heat shock protein)